LDCRKYQFDSDFSLHLSHPFKSGKITYLIDSGISVYARLCFRLCACRIACALSLYITSLDIGIKPFLLASWLAQSLYSPSEIPTSEQEMTIVPTELTVKARLRNFGDGILVVVGDAVKFYVETGRFRKHRKIAREIPMTDVESIERQENDLSITWKENIDIFVVAQPSQVEPIYEWIMAALKEHTKEEENKETANQKQVELANLTLKVMETTDSLFDILRNLNGRVNWNLVENNFKKSEENVKNLASHPNSLCLDVTHLSAAVQERHPKEIAEKTYDVLRAMYEHFDEMPSTSENAEQSHPNNQDARLTIQASYILNDMLLGAIVGDDAAEKEQAELLKVLDDLARVPGSKIDVNAAKTSLDNACAEKEKQGLIIEDIRLMLEQQLKELASPAAVTS
jgi:hypothetical protein